MVHFTNTDLNIPVNKLQSLCSSLINDQIMDKEIYLDLDSSEYESLSLKFLNYTSSALLRQKLDEIICH